MNFTILIIDRSEATIGEIREALGAAGLTYRVISASNNVEGFKILLNDQIDLVLCSLDIPDIDGHQFLTMFYERTEFAEIPIIALISGKDVETETKALNAGASDYLTKPFSHDELRTRVKIHLRVRKLREELREKEVELERLSQTDGLTKVFNRRRLLDIVDLEFLRAERYQSNLSFIMVSLDNFQELYDSWGSEVGNHALVTTATLLENGLRANDTIGRYDADRFGIVLPETDIHGAAAVAKRYRSQLEELSIIENKERLRLTASFGAVYCPHKEIVVVHDLMKKADRALSIAKAGGGNRVVILEQR